MKNIFIDQFEQVTAQTKGMFAIEAGQQEDIVQLLRNNGAKTGLELSVAAVSYCSYSPPHSAGSPTGSPYSFQVA